MDYNELIKEFIGFCKNASILVIYGAGVVGEMVYDFLENEKIEVEYFVTTNKVEEEKKCGKLIKKIDDITKGASIIIAASKKNADEMIKNVDLEFDKVYYNAELMYQLYLLKSKKATDSIKILDEYLISVNGNLLSKETFYIVCPASIGDTLYVAALVSAYKKYTGIKKICLIVKRQHFDIAKGFFSVDEVIESDDWVMRLDMFSVYTQTFLLNNYLYGHFKKDRRLNLDPELYDEKNDDIINRYARLIFQMREYDFSAYTDVDFSFLCGSEIERNNNIIIMPYAQTAPLMPVEFWEKIVGKLIEKEYVVYTNVGRKGEKPVRGTKVISEGVIRTAQICNNSYAVISIRSGMCDLLGFTDSRLFVLNTSEEMSMKWDIRNIWIDKSIICIDTWNKDYNIVIDELLKGMDDIK